VIENEFFEAIDCVLAKNAVQIKRIVLDVIDRLLAAFDIQDNQPAIGKVVIIRKQAAARDDTMRVIRHPLDVDGANFPFFLPHPWVIEKHNNIGHAAPPSRSIASLRPLLANTAARLIDVWLRASASDSGTFLGTKRALTCVVAGRKR
jgi:hypothetical protein